MEALESVGREKSKMATKEKKDECFWITPEPKERYDTGKRAELWDDEGKTVGGCSSRE